MPPLPHPESARLLRATTALLPSAVSWQGEIYRFAAPRHASHGDLISGEGSRLNGARWNPPGSFPAVYGSLAPETPLKETQAFAERFGFLLARRLPLVLAAIHVDLRRVLDLTDGRVRQRLRVSAQRMRDERWWLLQAAGQEAVTQAIGRAAHESGFEALLVPCAPVPGAVNLVVFPHRIMPGSSIRAL